MGKDKEEWKNLQKQRMMDNGLKEANITFEIVPKTEDKTKESIKDKK